MGQEEYHLKSLADDQLLAGLASIVRRRNQITAEFLAYLAELDERQLFLDLGFPSLFEYCLVTLGLCESTAGRHIAAARVCRNHPQVFSMVASGALHASALSLLRKHLTPENAGELFELCTHRSARKVEELLAARFARPDVRDLVRRLPRFATPEAVSPAQAGFTLNVGCSAEQSPTEAPSREPPAVLEKAPIEALSREPPAATKPEDAPKPRRLEPLSTDRYGVHFTADGEFRELLERVRGLAGHRRPDDLDQAWSRSLRARARERALRSGPQVSAPAWRCVCVCVCGALRARCCKARCSEARSSEARCSEARCSEARSSEARSSEARFSGKTEPETKPSLSGSGHARGVPARW